MTNVLTPFYELIVWPKQALPASEIDKLMMECRVYQTDESITEDWYIEDKGKTNDGLPFIKWPSIDKYWAKVFKRTTDLGLQMYLTLSKLVKCVIFKAYGNADVERGFSLNALIVTADRSALNALSVSGLRTVQDAVRQTHSGRVTDVKITPMLLVVQQAHLKYQADLELNAKAQQEVQSQQAAKDAAHQARSLKCKELADEEKQLQSEIDAAEKVMSDGNKQLADAIHKKDTSAMSVAQVLLVGAQEKMSKNIAELKAILATREDIEQSRAKKPCH